ncbi:MAG: PD-(D/E)XK nuclease family protein [Coxiellaceae bacterium]|nr:PD-(D/E)XK nuclease family protein [Coxiellaceae bacterium]
MYCEIFTTSLPGDQLVTPNRRLTTRLLQWHQQQFCTSKSTWPVPLINSLPDWLMQCWQVVGDKTVLPSHSSLLLWQQIIAHDLQSQPLVSARALAELAQSAYDNLTQWNLSLTEITKAKPNQDHLQFQQWAQAFEQQLKQQQLITNQQLPKLLSEQLVKTPLSIKRLRLYGFDQIPPNLSLLLKQLEQHIAIEYISPPKRNNHINRTSSTTPQHELHAMATWAKQQWQQGKQRIACVHPQLSTLRHQLESTFKQVFDQATPYNISSGVSLDQCDMINCALTLLGLQCDQLDVAVFSSVLRSPYINGNVIDNACAAYLDKKLFDNGRPVINQQQLTSAINHAAQSFPKASLPQRLRHWLSLQQQSPKRNHIAWLQHTIERLNAIGWPGQRGFDSQEHQIHQHWTQILQNFLQLGNHLQSPSNSAALSQLRFLCQQHTFQAQTSDEPIQILGALEAAGNDFDCLWLAGLTDNIWPPSAKPNPLLPFSLQTQHQLPHATAQREYEYCAQLTQQLIDANPKVIVSHAQQEQDTALQVSPIIHAIAQVELDCAAPQQQQTITQPDLEQLDDDSAPAVTDHENIKGGSWIISQQANCPFKAFASVRLGAEAIGELHEGIDARDKGTLVHACLDIIWQQLKTHAQLIQLDELALDHLIDQTVQQVLSDFSEHTEQLFLHSEQQRLRKLLQQWLAFEKQRQPFSVQSTEQRFEYPLQQLTLRIVVDRIDQLESGETLVIDYKTGIQSMFGWFDERLTQPQLPLYATIKSLNADGLAYAEVKRGKFAFKGVAANDINQAGIKPIESIIDKETGEFNYWSDMIKHWQQQISTLAIEFIAGNAQVDPDESSQPCGYCDFQSLCRINH